MPDCRFFEQKFGCHAHAQSTVHILRLSSMCHILLRFCDHNVKANNREWRDMCRKMACKGEWVVTIAALQFICSDEADANVDKGRYME